MSRDHDQQTTRRRRAVRTALVLGGVVLIIYLGFIVRGVISAA